jgi:hypothetical protein
MVVICLVLFFGYGYGCDIFVGLGFEGVVEFLGWVGLGW